MERGRSFSCPCSRNRTILSSSSRDPRLGRISSYKTFQYDSILYENTDFNHCRSKQWSVDNFNSCAISYDISTPAGPIYLRRYGVNIFIIDNWNDLNKKWIVFYIVDQVAGFVKLINFSSILQNCTPSKSKLCVFAMMSIQ